MNQQAKGPQLTFARLRPDPKRTKVRFLYQLSRGGLLLVECADSSSFVKCKNTLFIRVKIHQSFKVCVAILQEEVDEIGAKWSALLRTGGMSDQVYAIDEGTILISIVDGIYMDEVGDPFRVPARQSGTILRARI